MGVPRRQRRVGSCALRRLAAAHASLPLGTPALQPLTREKKLWFFDKNFFDFFLHSGNQRNYQSVSHAKIPKLFGHSSCGPIIRKALDALSFFWSKNSYFLIRIIPYNMSASIKATLTCKHCTGGLVPFINHGNSPFRINIFMTIRCRAVFSLGAFYVLPSMTTFRRKLIFSFVAMSAFWICKIQSFFWNEILFIDSFLFNNCFQCFWSCINRN